MSLDTLWLTYAELADRLSITGESARNLVRRRQWPRKPGNDGTQRIGVPKDYLDERAMEEAILSPIEAPTDPPIIAAIIPPVEGGTEAATVAALEAHIETLKEIADRERSRSDAERARADGERNRADGLAAELVRVRSDGAEQVAGIERNLAKLRELVDTMKAPTAMARPWWRRLAQG